MTTTLPLIRIVDDDEELRNSQKMLLASLGGSVKTYESALAFCPMMNSLGQDASFSMFACLA